ncbi:DNA-processing protein DprA [Ornithinimicrobium sp. Arc0846-15]|nr:DNA-processing protein DprA [Ornithinimicrobium laminariae]
MSEPATDTEATRGQDVDDLRVRLTWARIAEPQDKLARRLIEQWGLRQALERVQTSISRGGGKESGIEVDIGARFAARLAHVDVDRELEMAAKVGAVILLPGQPGWPSRLDELEHPPWALWSRGEQSPAVACHRSISIVGARASTHYGDREASSLAGELCDQGFSIVSGAAYGIDAAAHRGALAAGGRTLAFLACGVDRAYPARHSNLLAQVAENGAVLSEVPPGAAPLRTRFLARNRLIAAASVGTVMVEAGLRSGARSTVSEAVALNRPVGALPGPVTSMVSAGCHEEIRAGRAVLVTDAAEVRDLCGAIGEDLAPPKNGPHRSHDGLEGLELRVWECLRPPGRRGMDVEEVTRVAGLSALEALSALGRLEASGRVRREGLQWQRV